MPQKIVNLTFAEALEAMEEGKKVKLPEWGGFWIWEEKDDTIVIFTKEGNILDFRDSTMMKQTLKFISERSDWKVMETTMEATSEAANALQVYNQDKK